MPDNRSIPTLFQKETPLRRVRSWRIHKVALLTLCVGALLLGGATGCQRQSSSRDVARKDVLAEIGTQILTIQDYQAALKQLSPSARRQYASLQRKAHLLEHMIHFEMLVLEARRRRLESDSFVRHIKQRAMVELLVKRISQKLRPSAVSTAEMRAYYRTHYHQFNRSEQRRAQHILFSVPAKADAAAWEKRRKEIMALMPEIKKANEVQGGFSVMVRKYSQDTATKDKRGDLGFSAHTKAGGSLSKPLADAIFSLKQPTQLAGPIRSSEGFHIVRLVSVKPAEQKSFSQAKALLRHKVLQQKRTQAYKKYIKSLRQKTKITINQDVLMKIKPLKKKADKGLSPPPIELQQPPTKQPSTPQPAKRPTAPQPAKRPAARVVPRRQPAAQPRQRPAPRPAVRPAISQPTKRHATQLTPAKGAPTRQAPAKGAPVKQAPTRRAPASRKLPASRPTVPSPTRRGDAPKARSAHKAPTTRPGSGTNQQATKQPTTQTTTRPTPR